MRQDHLGDMLDRMTRGPYRSTPRCVAINRSGRDRLSVPLFFDPNFFIRVLRIEGLVGSPDVDNSAGRRALGAG